MSDCLIALESLLISDINDISRTDVSQQIFLAAKSFFSFLLLDNCLYVVFKGARLVHRGDKFGIYNVRIIPFRLARFTMLVVRPLLRNPVLIVSGLIED